MGRRVGDAPRVLQAHLINGFGKSGRREQCYGFVILSNAKDLLLAVTERKQVFRFAQDDNS
jgi:hypothetical protein